MQYKMYSKDPLQKKQLKIRNLLNIVFVYQITHVEEILMQNVKKDEIKHTVIQKFPQDD